MAVRLSRDGHQPFVGRVREMAVAVDILADSERTGVVLIGGESGLGKTRLVTEIIAAAPEEPVVVRCGAVPRPTPVPFELVQSATGPTLAGVNEAAPTGTDDGTTDLVARTRAEAEALRTVTDGPTIYVFEDVHWADAESLDVIERLMVAGPLVATILITYRPNALQSGDPTSVFLQRAERRSNVVQFRLEPLRREEVEAYLVAAGRQVDTATVEHIHTRTGGNPLLLSELVAAVADDANLTAGLPWTLAEMLRPEIERLPPPERAVAEAVAVLGTEVDFDLLAAAVDASEGELLDRLRSLVENGILVESGPDRFGFRHDLVREAVADSLFTREHRKIHAAVHDALLAAESTDVAALVSHATGAGRTKEAADAARDAAKEAMVDGRSHQALAFAEQALLEHTNDIELLRTAVVAAWKTGQDRTALHHLEQWADLIDGDPTERAEVLHHRVRLHWEIGNMEGADAAAEELLALAETMDEGQALAQALADVAQHHMLRGREGQAIALADRAIAVASAVGPAAADAALQARAERASALISSGGGQARVDAIGELLSVAAEAEVAKNHIVASRAMHNVPFPHPSVDAKAHVEQMRRFSERAGMSWMAEAGYRRSLIEVAWLDGDRETFESLLESAMEELGPATKIDLLAAKLALEDGRWDEARRLAERLPLYQQSAHYSRWWRDGLLAMADLLGEDDAEPLRRWFDELPNDHLAETFAVDLVLQFLSVLLDAGLRPELARFMAREVVDQTFEPAFLAVRADLEGRAAEADALYAEALESGMCQNLREQVEIHLARARLAEAAGPGRGRVHLEAAAARTACWPGPARDRILAQLGQAEPALEPSQALTPREREVALLVARSLTNGGIAEELYISTKTASVHVSNILAKLGMGSRTEIATWVAQGGLATGRGTPPS